jgi:predicted membrane channel-forming protein YqfA (hemolysin III family)
MFIRPHTYTCLGIEWLTQGGVVYSSGLLFFMLVFMFIRPLTYTCLGIECH